MKVALVHPPLRNVLSAATPKFVDKNRGCMPPMGLLYIQAAIEKSRHQSVFIDANLANMTHQETAQTALSYYPDIVGIQAMTFTLPDAYMVAKEIKKLSPKTKIVLGGPHPTIYPNETIMLEYVDYAVVGEGEKSFKEFLDNYKDWHNPIIKSDWIVDLDTVPFPARRSSDYNSYSSVLAEKNPITVMITSRGCPFQCVFCNRMGRQYRMHSAKYVLKEFRQIEQLGIQEVFIHDDTFSISQERVEFICEQLIETHSQTIWEARTRVDCVNQKLLSLMKQAGCKRLSFGVESGSPIVLEAMRKGISLQQIEQAFKWCKEEGITTLADFMIGNLNEKIDDINMTIDFMHKIKPDYVQFSICSPYPDTPLYKIGLEKGLYKTDIWREFAKNPMKEFESPVWTENFTKEELVSITKKAYKSFYMTPQFIFRQLKKIGSFKQLKTMVKGAVGMLK